MFEQGISAKWIQRAQWAIYIFFGGFALLALWYVFAAAFRREVFQSLIGAGVVWGSIGLGIGMHCVSQMAAVVNANRQSILELSDRIAELQASLAEARPTVELGASEERVDELVAADVQSDAYPRLTEPAEALEPLAMEQDALSDEQAAESDDAPSDFRTAFREALFDGQLAEALDIGQRMLDADPQSAMAKQFVELRPLLEQRNEALIDSGEPVLV